MTTLRKDWWVYHGDRDKPDPAALDRLPPPPPWRTFQHGPEADERHDPFCPLPEEIELVNAAIYLRRPLLVTGNPGCGKTSLARSIAHELGLGQLLVWPINTRTTITDGLYRYDAIARLQDASLLAHRKDLDTHDPAATLEIAKYLRLGPLGEAMVPSERPRVLLIDEIDKSDVDLPNDLLHVLEEGRFEIPELTRLRGTKARLAARRGDGSEEIELPDGFVRCRAFPIVVMTSNGEREFPPAFLRRCVRLTMTDPTRERLRKIVEAHLGAVDRAKVEALIERFLARRPREVFATDQLLNAVYLTTRGVDVSERQKLVEMIFQSIASEE